MGRCQFKREGNNFQYPKDLPKQYLTLTHCVLSVWWMNLMAVLGNYVIRPGEVYKVMMMTTSYTDLGYNYDRQRLKNLPEFVVTTIWLVWISTLNS